MKTSLYISLRRGLAPIIRTILEKSKFLRGIALYLVEWIMPPSYIWKGDTIQINPKDFGVTLELVSTGEYEAKTMEVIRELLKPKMVFVDIGANIGLYSLLAAKEEARVIAFEPDKDNVFLLRQNTKKYDVMCIQAAVSDYTGKCQLYKSELNTADHRIYEVFGRESEEVNCTRLDDALLEADMIKMDIEGAEEKALKGMERILKTKPILIIECWPSELKKAGTNAVKMFKKLEDMGYELSMIDDGAKTIERVKAEGVTKYEVSNILCT